MSDERRARVVKIIEVLKNVYPNAKVALRFETPFQLLVSTILAAQSTDKKANEISSVLFENTAPPPTSRAPILGNWSRTSTPRDSSARRRDRSSKPRRTS